VVAIEREPRRCGRGSCSRIALHGGILPIDDLARRDEGTAGFALGNPRLLGTLPAEPFAEEVPQDLQIGEETPG
jgi:hypothetical protein